MVLGVGWFPAVRGLGAQIRQFWCCYRGESPVQEWNPAVRVRCVETDDFGKCHLLEEPVGGAAVHRSFWQEYVRSAASYEGLIQSEPAQVGVRIRVVGQHFNENSVVNVQFLEPLGLCGQKGAGDAHKCAYQRKDCGYRQPGLGRSPRPGSPETARQMSADTPHRSPRDRRKQRSHLGFRGQHKKRAQDQKKTPTYRGFFFAPEQDQRDQYTQNAQQCPGFAEGETKSPRKPRLR